MLTLDAVTYRYPAARQEALSGVTLVVGDGQVVGLVGASESGKSTLCLIATGLAPRSVGGTLEGRLLLDGDDVSGWPIHELTAHVGICFQNPSTQLSQVSDTVFEEVAFGAMNLGLDRLEVAARTVGALRALEIDDLAERHPSKLSGGQVQLVAVAGLLAMRPRHLVLDEPTAQLDPAGTRLVGDALARLAGHGTALLIASHDTDLLSRICSRVAVIAGAAIVTDGPTAEVLSDPRMDEWGVELPARQRLAHALASAGVAMELPA
jgi:energy-coupling factor transport system ATP-binding protein